MHTALWISLLMTRIRRSSGPGSAIGNLSAHFASTKIFPVVSRAYRVTRQESSQELAATRAKPLL